MPKLHRLSVKFALWVSLISAAYALSTAGQSIVLFAGELQIAGPKYASSNTTVTKWSNFGIALLGDQKGTVRKVKIGPALAFRETSAFGNIMHGLEFVVSPGLAMKRKRLYLYDANELAPIWPELRTYFKKQNVKTAIFSQTNSGSYIGVPIKWNEAFAATMSGAFVGYESAATSSIPDAVTSDFFVYGLAAGQGLKPDTKGLRIMLNGSDPKSTFADLLPHYNSVKNAKNSVQNFDTFIGFDSRLDEISLIDPNNSALKSIEIPPPVTTVFTYKLVNGRNLNSVSNWASE